MFYLVTYPAWNKPGTLAVHCNTKEEACKKARALVPFKSAETVFVHYIDETTGFVERIDWQEQETVTMADMVGFCAKECADGLGYAQLKLLVLTAQGNLWPVIHVHRNGNALVLETNA